MSTKRLTTLAMLIAVYVLLSNLTPIRLIQFKFTLEAFPILVAAFFYGPFDGMIVGLVGSSIYQILFSSYGITLTTPLWILPHAFSGFLAGFLFLRSEKKDALHLGIISTLAAFSVTLLNTLALYVDSRLYGYYSPQLVFGSLALKFVSGILLSAVFALILPKLLEQLKKVI